ncbi:MAG: hypothetical protein HYV09_33550 [Deltaproteobacteria bacterium]|nr:hypothetical protein [Deltaproteobacteria bacterium]
MNEQAVRRAISSHKSVADPFRRDPRIVLAAARRRHLHRAPLGWAELGQPARDLRELRDVARRSAWWDTSALAMPDPVEVYFHAALIGYRVDDSSFYSTRKPSHTEREAFQIAKEMLLEPQPSLWVDRLDMPMFDSLRERVCALTPYFVVPDPQNRPHLIRQFWVVATGPDTVRWLALEVDSESRQTEEMRASDRALDASLDAEGVEVYRLAGWWFRIDPYRAIVEFFRAAGLLRRDARMHGEERLRTINDYICECCGNPMDRSEAHSIQDVLHDDSEFTVHYDCVGELQRGEGMPAGERRRIA